MGKSTRIAAWILVASMVGLAARAGDDPAPDASAVADLLPFGPARVAGWAAADGIDAAWRQAVDRGLRWLAAHQAPSGTWHAADFGRICDGRPFDGTSDGPGDAALDVGVTGMALAAFLGAGVEPGEPGPYGDAVARGLTWLRSIQDARGSLGKRDAHAGVNHAWAALALVEGYGAGADEATHAAAARALDGAEASPDADAAMARALFAAVRVNRAAVAAGLEAPFPGADGAWAALGAASGNEGADAPTASALLLQLRMGRKVTRKSPLAKAIDRLEDSPPRWEDGQVDLLAWLDGAHALAAVGGKPWKVWRKALGPALVEHQRKDTDPCRLEGSWDPMGTAGADGGRVQATALAVLTLLAPVRFSPSEELAKSLAPLVRNAEVRPSAKRRLLAAMAIHDARRFDEVVGRALEGREPDLLLPVLRAIGPAHPPSSRDLERLAALAAGKEPATVRVPALLALGRMGVAAEPHVGTLLLAMDDADAGIAGAARRALLMLAPVSSRARSAVEAALRATDPLERLAAAGQLLAADPTHAKAREILLAGLDAEDPAERRAAAEGLGLEVPAWAKPSTAQLRAAAEAGLPVAFENGLGMRFLLVPAGTFTMGSPEGEKERLPDETPHAVTLTRPFYLQVTEVTNAQFHRWRKDHHSGHHGTTDLTTDNRPVLQVTHLNAQVFADWVDGQDPAHRYRLPTEAEWEYAARAGTTTRYWWGEDETKAGQYENVGDLSARAKFVHGFGQAVETTPGWRFFDTEDGHVFTTDVASFPPNPWGLYDMLGNASEWVEDWREPYPATAVRDPQPPTSGDARVFRGGSWVASPHQTRAAMRGLLAVPHQPGDGTLWIGFRLLAEPVR